MKLSGLDRTAQTADKTQEYYFFKKKATFDLCKSRKTTLLRLERILVECEDRLPRLVLDEIKDTLSRNNLKFGPTQALLRKATFLLNYSTKPISTP